MRSASFWKHKTHLIAVGIDRRLDRCSMENIFHSENNNFFNDFLNQIRPDSRKRAQVYLYISVSFNIF